MLNVLDILKQFFRDTSVGSYWCYMWIGVGVVIAFLAIYENLRK